MAARKPLAALSPAYRRRLEAAAARQGLPLAEARRQPGFVQRARGHAQTPATPRQALRRPQDYPAYVARHTDALRALSATDRGRADVVRALTDQTGTRGPITPIAPATVDPGQYERRRTFPNLADAQAYADVPYGTSMLIWPEGPDTWSVWARKTTR